MMEACLLEKHVDFLLRLQDHGCVCAGRKRGGEENERLSVVCFCLRARHTRLMLSVLANLGADIHYVCACACLAFCVQRAH